MSKLASHEGVSASEIWHRWGQKTNVGVAVTKTNELFWDLTYQQSQANW